MPPRLVIYSAPDRYRQHYEECYCLSAISTFDGLRVFFRARQFDDAFYKSANRRARDKSIFDWDRAARIDWIAAALRDPNAELYVGWDRDKKRVNPRRRVAIVYGNYVVILSVPKARTSAEFVTAYVAQAKTLSKIRAGPRWT